MTKPTFVIKPYKILLRDLTNYLTNGPLWFVGVGCKHHYFQNNFYETVDCGAHTKVCRAVQTNEKLCKVKSNQCKPMQAFTNQSKILQTDAN